MKFSGEEVVFYRLKIRSKTANVAKVDGEKCEDGVKTLRVDTRRAVRPGDIYGPLPRGRAATLQWLARLATNPWARVRSRTMTARTPPRFSSFTGR